MNVYSDLKRAQLEAVSKATTAATVPNRIILDTDTGNPFIADGTSWRPLGSGASAPGAVQWTLQDNSPTQRFLDGVEYLDFTNELEQAIWAAIPVPTDYVAGTQIFLLGGQFLMPAPVGSALGNVLFKATSFLIKPGAGSISNRSQSWKSLNAKIAATGAADQLTNIGTIDLTSSTGKVKNAANNDASVAAGDLLIVKLAREVQSENASANNAVPLLRHSFTAKFTL